jgi:hypothetical protein
MRSPGASGPQRIGADTGCGFEGGSLTRSNDARPMIRSCGNDTTNERLFDIIDAAALSADDSGAEAPLASAEYHLFGLHPLLSNDHRNT